MSSPLRIIQISDTHLFSDSSKTLLGVPTQKSFEAVLDLIRQEEKKIDLIIHSGDVAQDYSPDAYVRFAEMIQTFQVPVYCIPGNHDDPSIMVELYPQGLVTNNKHIVTKHWQIILLDSHKPHSVAGELNPLELKYLEHCLQTHPELKAAVFFHHQPIQVDSRWLDNVGLLNADKLWEILAKFPQVKAVIFGHIHQEYDQERNGIKCIAAPSTCFQFMRKQNHFGLEKLSPGYRWIDFYDDGRMETEIKRTDEYVGKFDGEAKGY